MVRDGRRPCRHPHVPAGDRRVGDPELAAALDELGPQSNAIAFQHGPDLHIRDGNADYAINAVFTDDETFLAYMASAQHQRIISDLVTPHLRARSAVQFGGTDCRLAAERIAGDAAHLYPACGLADHRTANVVLMEQVQRTHVMIGDGID